MSQVEQNNIGEIYEGSCFLGRSRKLENCKICRLDEVGGCQRKGKLGENLKKKFLDHILSVKDVKTGFEKKGT